MYTFSRGVRNRRGKRGERGAAEVVVIDGEGGGERGRRQRQSVRGRSIGFSCLNRQFNDKDRPASFGRGATDDDSPLSSSSVRRRFFVVADAVSPPLDAATDLCENRIDL